MYVVSDPMFYLYYFMYAIYFFIQETSSALQDIKLIDIECDCCNTIELNIGISTVVIIYCGDTLIVTRYFFF